MTTMPAVTAPSHDSIEAWINPKLATVNADAFDAADISERNRIVTAALGLGGYVDGGGYGNAGDMGYAFWIHGRTCSVNVTLASHAGTVSLSGYLGAKAGGVFLNPAA